MNQPLPGMVWTQLLSIPSEEVSTWSIPSTTLNKVPKIRPWFANAGTGAAVMAESTFR